MAFVAILWPLVGIVSMVGFIWLCVVAFKHHVGWGLAVFFLSPFAAVFFAIKHWQDSKRPFLVYMASLVMFLGLVAYTFVVVGSEMVTLARQIESGELTEDEAMNRMIEQMDSSGMLTEEQEAELRRMQAMVAQAEAEQREAGEEPIEIGSTSARRESRPADTGKRKIRLLDDGWATPEPEQTAAANAVPPGYRRVSFNNASDYLGREIRIVSKNGSEHRGRLAEVATDMLLLERQLNSGTISFELRRNEVDSLLVAYR